MSRCLPLRIFALFAAGAVHAAVWLYCYHKPTVVPPARLPQTVEISLLSRPKPLAAQPFKPPPPKPLERRRPVPKKRQSAMPAPATAARDLPETAAQPSTAPQLSSTPAPLPVMDRRWR